MNESKCRQIVKERSGGACEVCGLEAVQMHHRKNRSQGGKWEPSCILHVCLSCHIFITENPKSAYEFGWSVKSHDDPKATPVLLADQDFWTLTDSGFCYPTLEGD
jgi:hypothetical protein